MFHPNLSSYSFRFHFWIVIWVNLNFGFLWIIISEISLLFIRWFLREIRSKLSVFFCSMDSSLSPLSNNIKFPNFYPHLIVRFDQIRRDHQILLEFYVDLTLLTTIPFNWYLFPKIGEFGINFDSWPCVFNDLAVSIRQVPLGKTLISDVACVRKTRQIKGMKRAGEERIVDKNGNQVVLLVMDIMWLAT